MTDQTGTPPPGTATAAIREASGVRQQTIAKAVGVPLAQMARWEAGEEIPDGPAAEAYARIIGGLAEQQGAGRD